MVLSFIVDERLGLKEEALGSHLGFAVSLHAQNMFHEQNFCFISLPSVWWQKTCREWRNIRKKKCTNLKLMWLMRLRDVYSHVPGGVGAGR